jgi:integrating conjugative element protein (TIGR03756 family)
VSIQIIIIILILLLNYSNIFADTNSTLITKSTLKAIPNCLHYKIKGVCYWAGKTGINTTPYIEHYLPDVVISVFNKAGDNPWTEANLGFDQAGKVAQNNIVSSLTGLDSGSGQHSFSDNHEQNVFFKETDLIGNPALAVLPNNGYILLPSTVTPFKPYFQSMLDSAMWKGLPQFPPAVIEEGYALAADIVHHVGTGLINWGGIYPHEGKIATSNDAKAAAVIAQRGGDLITSSDMEHLSGHIFLQLSNECGQHCKAYPIQENSDKTLFQMIYPITEDKCDYFGKTIDYGNDLESKGQGSYVFVVWRYYQGCKDGDGKFIGKIIAN